MAETDKIERDVMEYDVVVGMEPTPPPPFWTWQRDADQIVDVVRLGRLVDRIGAVTTP